MKEFTIGKNEDGQRLDRILQKILPAAGKGFLFKMLRKKNIVLNDKKAEGNERVSQGDVLKLYLSDDTFAQFAAGAPAVEATKEIHRDKLNKALPSFDFGAAIIYEDEDIILVNKPVGMLSQPADNETASLNDYLIEYLDSKGALKDAGTFRPSVCNRLDRNTSGIVACGCSIKGLRFLSEQFRSRTLDKYYMAVCMGEIKNQGALKGFIQKDEKTNKVTVLQSPQEGAERIETYYRPVKSGQNATLLEVKLVTGKTHQIRAHLASIGHPIGGDIKYGNEMFNRSLRDRCKVRTQLLMAYRLVFPGDIKGEFERLAGREFTLDVPEIYSRAL